MRRLRPPDSVEVAIKAYLSRSKLYNNRAYLFTYSYILI